MRMLTIDIYSYLDGRCISMHFLVHDLFCVDDGPSLSGKDSPPYQREVTTTAVL
jgi:hypothetical protein